MPGASTVSARWWDASYTSGDGQADAFIYSAGLMTDLGSLGGGSVASGINNSGQVVGWSYTSGGQAHAFLYSAGTMTDLGTLGGTSSYASAINNSGQAVGVSDTSGGQPHAFLYSGGTMTDLGGLSGGIPARPLASTTPAKWRDGPMHSTA